MKNPYLIRAIETFKDYLKIKSFAKRCSILINLGYKGQRSCYKMFNARLIKPSNREMYDFISYVEIIKNTIRIYINELNVKDAELDKIIDNIEDVEIEGLGDCLNVLKECFELGVQMERKFIKMRYRCICGSLNIMEVVVCSLVFMLVFYIFIK